MKKILKYILLSLLAIILLALMGVHIAYVTFSPDDRGIPVAGENLVYFQESYDQCRSAFLAGAEEAISTHDLAKLISVRVPSGEDDKLYMDLLYIPPADSSDKLLVLSSGVHGVEGYTGSAVQQMFLEEILGSGVLSEMGVLLIHGVNPYGFKYKRRVSENNVDMNRGCGVDPELFETGNPGYGALYDMLNPHAKASTASMRSRFFYITAISKMLKESMSVLRQAILQGQYEYPEGIYFGGKKFEPQIDSLTRILPGYFSDYLTILAIDLHTGYGSRRVLHLFPNPVDDPEIKQKTESVFEGHHIDWGDGDDFYTINGGFADAYLPEINPAATYLYMVFEWGTMDTEKTFGSLKALEKIIIENQGFHYGYTSAKQEQKVKQDMTEAYYSTSEAWRSEVLKSGRDMLKEALANFSCL
ncbi:MAG: M14 family metallopeptidase [Bacteroidota bacterium]